jgi:large subunit ribosomal protein L19
MNVRHRRPLLPGIRPPGTRPRLLIGSLPSCILPRFQITASVTMQTLIQAAERPSFREKALNFSIGDTVDVHTRILEGDKERIQIFNGIVIAKRGGGMREMFTVRRIVAGEGVERSFPLHSPKVADVVVKRHSRVRRAKLYYLRDRVGKATRLSERRAKKGEAETN